MKEFTDPLDLKFLQRLTDKKTGYDADMLKCPKCKEKRIREDYISKHNGEHFHLCKKCRYAHPKTIGTENVKWELGQGEIDRPKTIELFEENIKQGIKNVKKVFNESKKRKIAESIKSITGAAGNE